MTYLKEKQKHYNIFIFCYHIFAIVSLLAFACHFTTYKIPLESQFSPIQFPENSVSDFVCGVKDYILEAETSVLFLYLKICIFFCCFKERITISLILAIWVTMLLSFFFNFVSGLQIYLQVCLLILETSLLERDFLRSLFSHLLEFL